MPQGAMVQQEIFLSSVPTALRLNVVIVVQGYRFVWEMALTLILAVVLRIG